jgi:hypothetical protein
MGVQLRQGVTVDAGHIARVPRSCTRFWFAFLAEANIGILAISHDSSVLFTISCRRLRGARFVTPCFSHFSHR